MNFATANKRPTWPHIPENVSRNLMEMPGRFLTEVAVVSSRRARLQVLVAQTWLAPGGRSRGFERLEIVRAVQLLYQIDERELAIPIMGDLGENGDPEALAGLGELASRNGDALTLTHRNEPSLQR